MAEFFEKLWEFLSSFFKSKTPDATNPGTEIPKPVPTTPAESGSKTEKETFLRLTDTRTVIGGLKTLKLEYIVDGVSNGSVYAVSGARGAQALRQGWQSVAGSMEPLPEGYYSLGGVEWVKGKVGDYGASWGEGLGPVWVTVNPLMKTSRSALGIHLDANKATSPGTAGCIGINTVDELKKVVSWFANPKTRPTKLTVNWGLGSVETKTEGPSMEVNFIKSPNHNPFRDSAINALVLHNTEGSVQSAINRFLDTGAQVSAHYIVGRNGAITQMVADKHTAWHSGNRTMNHRSIGIEIEAGANVGKGMTDIQEQVVIRLVKRICDAYNIASSNVVPHRDVVATNCPGSIWKDDKELEAWKKEHNI